MDDRALRAEVGLAFAQRRCALRLSQDGVARTAHCSHATVSRLERGEYLPPRAQLDAIGAAVGLDAAAVGTLLEDVVFRARVLEDLLVFGRRHRAVASSIVMLLGDLDLSLAGAGALVNAALLSARKAILASALLPALEDPAARALLAVLQDQLRMPGARQALTHIIDSLLPAVAEESDPDHTEAAS